MLLSVVRIYPRPGLEHSTLEVFESLKGPISALAGCLGCSVAVEHGDSAAVCFTERWRSREALELHLRSALYNRVLEVMECSCRSPEVEFYEVREVGGLEMVEKVRMPS